MTTRKKCMGKEQGKDKEIYLHDFVKWHNHGKKTDLIGDW